LSSAPRAGSVQMSATSAIQSPAHAVTSAGGGGHLPAAPDDADVAIAQLAVRVCSAACASLAVHRSGTVWCNADAVLDAEAAPEEDPFLACALRTDGLFEVPDTLLDYRFAERKVHGRSVRSYAGSTLRSDQGHTVTLAVYGTLPGRLTDEQRGMLELLTRQALAHSDLRAQVVTLALLAEPRDTGQALLASTAGDLLKAEALFRNTFDQAPIGIAYSNRDGRIFRCNPAFGDLLRFDPNELKGTSSGSLTHPDDVKIMSRELTRLWNSEVRFVDVEKRYGRKDGSYVWVRATTALVRDAGGTPECAVEFLRDISQRKQLAAELLQQQTLLEAVITDLPIALVACDVSGRITHHNRAAVELHGIQGIDASADRYPNAQVPSAATYLVDGITPLSPEERPLARALRGETISNLELVVVPPNASPRQTLSSARRLIDPSGQLLGAVAVVQDTTERKQSELELERVHKELIAASREAGMAEVATNVLHNVGNILNSVNISASLVAERVKQSKAPLIANLAALLQDQGSRLGEFLTTDPRGTAIPQYLATLGDQFAADRQMTLKELAALRENVEHIKETVAMQQSYAKLCGVTETVRVPDLVEDSLRLNAGAFARHGVTLQREFGEVPPIIVDKHKVLQILVNLVRNAKYACDESGRLDKLLTLRIESAPMGVRISVIDNGVGIAPENMSRLFTHGFTTRQSGHGFGLHSGALAAQELGGSLRAESDGPGRGAAFILELPLQPPDARRA